MTTQRLADGRRLQTRKPLEHQESNGALRTPFASLNQVSPVYGAPRSVDDARTLDGGTADIEQLSLSGAQVVQVVNAFV